MKDKLELDVRGSRLVYRGEGNANIVVSVQQSGVVIRLPKSVADDENQVKKLQSTERYINTVMLPLLPRYISPVHIINLGSDELEMIKQTISTCRPERRLSKNIFCPAALVMRDQCCPEDLSCDLVLSVEIKPKQGFIPRQQLKDKICNFCLKQKYKKIVEDETETNYCPLDLFSRDEDRIAKALKNLLDKPKNNLKMFGNGDMLHSEVSTQSSLCFLDRFFGDHRMIIPVLVNILLGQTNDSVKAKDVKSLEKCKLCESGSCNTERSILKKSILDDILELQEKAVDDEEAEEILTTLLNEDEVDLNTLQEFISGAQFKEDQYSSETLHRIEKLRKYAVTVTARDLSFIITIAKKEEGINSGSNNTIRVNDQLYWYEISLIDLDPKDLTRISKYVQRRKKLINFHKSLPPFND